MKKEFYLFFKLIFATLILLLIANYSIKISKLNRFLPFLQNATYSPTTRISRNIYSSKNESDKKYVVYECTKKKLCGILNPNINSILLFSYYNTTYRIKKIGTITYSD